MESYNVTAQNGDSWTGTASPLGGRTSSPITGETTYTLSCTNLDGNPVTRSAGVRVIPGWQDTLRADELCPYCAANRCPATTLWNRPRLPAARRLRDSGQ